MKFTPGYFSVGIVTAVVATLTACGGGGGGGGASDNPSTITGVAATGLAIANGKVSLKCIVGDTVSNPVSTNADGSFSIDISKMTLPCVARVEFTNSSGATEKLHSLVTAPGNVNITPVTDAVMANLSSNGSSADSFDTMDATEVKSYTAARVMTATQKVKKQMDSLGVNTAKLPDDVIGTKLAAAHGSNKGDSHDNVLDDLKHKLHDHNKHLHDMENDMHDDHEDNDHHSGGLSTSTGKPGDAAAGKVAYDANCASCHGPKMSDAKNSAKTLEAIRENEGGMGKLKGVVTVAMADNIATYLANGLGTGPVLLAQSITFANPGNQTLGVAPAALSASTNAPLLAVAITSSTPTVCTVAGTTLTLVKAGSCTLSANSGASTTYSAAPTVRYTFTVAPAGGVVLTSQTITFANPGNQTIGVAPAALSATASSGLPVTISSSTPIVCTVAGNTLTLVAAGSCNLSANSGATATFSAAPTVSYIFTVAPAPVLTSQTITFANPGNQTIGVAPAALSATASSGLPVTIASSTPAVCTVAGSTLTLVAAGNCSLSATRGATATFSAAPTVSYTFTVAPAAGVVQTQTISFGALGPQKIGTPATLSATATSGLAVTFDSTTATICTVSGNTLTLLAAGNCTVRASQAGSSVWAAATANITVAVTAPVAVVSATNGKVLYASNSCGSCHGTPPAYSNVLAGANDPTLIRNAITGDLGGMNRPAYVALTNAQLADIAAYLATPNI